ncbi:MAG: hypothetical protein PUC45_05425 [Oscillospiraceae bacterium]|nr:hypothetical protein [Oscillospiraceae bacterium]
MKRLKRALSGLTALCLALSLVPAMASAAETSGSFTVTSMNVDGLPNKILGISINSDGPGSDGTKAISAKMAEYGWDIIGVSEDFNYNTELMSSLTDYDSGTHRGGVSRLNNDTDGLNLIWKNTASVTGEKCTSWNTHYSTGIFDTGNGADGMIDKGYRYYAATVAEGVTVDVYILHMDADSDTGDIKARESQLTQLANAIKDSNNGNPIIVMGDTNCRYTREDLEGLFIDAINEDERFTIQDAWIELVRNGDYPAYGSEALVAKDKGGTYDYPDAEIVDKVFYINNTDSDVTLNAKKYTIAEDFTDENGTALADHWPVVVKFAYTLTTEEPHEHSYTAEETKAATCTGDGVMTYTCQCGESYTEAISALGHDYQVTANNGATCTEAGTVTYTCTRCGDSYTEEGGALGHDYQEAVTKEATCTESGTVTKTCTRCGDVQNSELAALGHDYQVKETLLPTCTVPGKTTFVCTRCQDTYDEEIPVVEHNFVDGVCSYCGQAEAVREPILGNTTTRIISGGEYALVFNSTMGSYTLRYDKNMELKCDEFSEKPGDSITPRMVWTVTREGMGYTISAVTDDGELYLAPGSELTYGGYRLTLQDDPYVWSMKVDSSRGSVRFYTNISRYNYYLRYFSAKQGWLASTWAAGVKLYEVR